MTVDPFGIKDHRELAAFLKDKDDDELVETLIDLGVPRVLRAIFEGMARNYMPMEGPREPAVVEWQIRDTARTDHDWQIVASRKGFTILAEPTADPDVVLRIDLVPFVRLMARDLRGIEALSSGALKLKGDLQLAIEMEAWFNE
jgi:SCP-2 sterol transfer family